MIRGKTEETSRFEVESRDGRRWQLVEYTTFIDVELAGDRSGPQWQPGVCTYRTSEGDGAVMEPNGTFTLLLQHERIAARRK